MLRERRPNVTTMTTAATARVKNKITRRENPRPAPLGLTGAVATVDIGFASTSVPVVSGLTESTAVLSGLSMAWLSFLLSRYVGIVLFPAPVQEAKDRRNKYQCRNRGAQQSTNDGTAEGSILLASVTNAKRHWNHADDHGQRGHDDRPETRVPCFNRRFHWISVVQESLLGEGNHENAVRCRYAHAHDCAHQRRDAERSVGDEQKQHDPRKSSGKRGDDDEGIKPGLKIHHNQHVNEDNRKSKAGQQSDI